MKKKWSSKLFEKERAEFFKKQKGCCALCGKHQSKFKKRLCLDHSHKKELNFKLRGLLCLYCNRYRVGRLDVYWAKKIYEYLKVENERTNS